MSEGGGRKPGATRGAARLAGEFVMLVVGVLVALAADSWWADRRDRAEIDVLLENVAAELRQNQAELTDALEFTGRMLGYNRELLRLIAGQRSRFAADSLRMMVLSTAAYADPTVSFGAYEILSSRGSAEFVDPDVLTDLAGHAAVTRRPRGGAAEITATTAAAITNLIGEYGGLLAFTPEELRSVRELPAAPGEPDFDGIPADPAFRNYAAVAYTLSDNYRGWTTARLDEVEALLAALEGR